jgi:glycosyltransferase involved in cell wall biosynthesis
MTTRTGLHIAFMGCRGIPQCWTGFETFAEELSTRLVERGHDVTVYCREEYSGRQPGDEYKGVKLVYTPYLKNRELERLSHESVSLVDSIRRDIDLYYVLGTPSGPLWAAVRPLMGSRAVVINTDGIEWRRPKWKRGGGQRFMRFAEWCVAKASGAELVSDSLAIQRYYRERYGRDSAFITNGAYLLNDLPEGALDRWDCTAGEYYLIACRIEPDNNIHHIISEFVASGSDKELVIAGGMNYETPYWDHVQGLARGHRVRFLGPVYGPMLVEKLHLGCYAYLHGHEMGGTNPSLLKAMGCGNCAIVLDTDYNTEVIADEGLRWRKERGSLTERIRWADAHPKEVRDIGERARGRIRDRYTWDLIADEHDRFFRRIGHSRGLLEA